MSKFLDACRNGQVVKVQKYLDEGAAMDDEKNNKDGETGLILASRYGHLEVVQELIGRGAQLNIAGKRGLTALARAAENGHLDTVKELVANDAEVGLRDGNGRTVLFISACCGQLDIFRELVSVPGVHVDDVDTGGMTALMWAAWNGHVDLCLELLDRGADVNIQASGGNTALNYAVRLNDVEKGEELVSFFLVRGSVVNSKDMYENTPLTEAAYRGRLAALRILLDAGADSNNKSYTGKTALIEACIARHVGVVEELLTRGVDKQVTDQEGKTAADYCETQELRDLLER